MKFNCNVSISTTSLICLRFILGSVACLRILRSTFRCVSFNDSIEFHLFFFHYIFKEFLVGFHLIPPAYLQSTQPLCRSVASAVEIEVEENAYNRNRPTTKSYVSYVCVCERARQAIIPFNQLYSFSSAVHSGIFQDLSDADIFNPYKWMDEQRSR